MSAPVMRALTLAEVDELIEQSDRLLAIYDLVLGADGLGEVVINRNNFAALLHPSVFGVRAIANNTQPIDLRPSLQ